MGGPGRDDTGIVIWQIAIVIAVLAVLAAVAGPRLGGLREKAVSVSLTATVTAAARALQEVYDEGGISGDGVNDDGSPKPALVARLGAVTEGVDWRAAWAYGEEDEAGTVRVQFLKTMRQPVRGVTGGPTACTPMQTDGTGPVFHNACRLKPPPSPPPPVSPPWVSWLGAHWLAARVHARAGDGSWACALVIHAVDTHTLSIAGAKKTGGSDKGPLLLVRNGRAREASTASDPAITWEEARDRLMRSRGVWYDSGGEALEGGLFDCSPVTMANSPGGSSARNGRSNYPPAEGEWSVPQARAHGAGWWTGPAVTGTLDVAP